jgi:hypothetical protein
MTKPVFSKILIAIGTALIVANVPTPASVRHSTGSHGGGGARKASSHGSGSSHRGGPSNFSGGRHSSGGSRSQAPVSSMHMGSARVNTGRMSGGSSLRLGGFSSRPSGNFAPSSTSGGRSFRSAATSPNFGGSGTSRAAAQRSNSARGGWHSFGNSNVRSMPVSTRIAANSMGSGWHSFGNLTPGRIAEVSRVQGSNVRGDGKWHSFGNSSNASLGASVSRFSFTRERLATASNAIARQLEFSSNRFSTNLGGSSRVSLFPSLFSDRSMTNFGSSRFGTRGFGSSGLPSGGFGSLGFSNSFVGSNLSLIPSLLFGGLFSLGTSGFGGGGILGGNILSFAIRSLVFGLGSNGFGQGGFAGGDFGFDPGGFGGDFGFDQTQVWPPCGARATFRRPSWAWSGYCEPYPNYPLGGNGILYSGDPRTGDNVTDDTSSN